MVMALTTPINYLAILVAGVVTMIIGSLWYGPIFGKLWIRLSGFAKKDVDKAKAKGAKGMWKAYLINFIAALVMADVLAWAMSFMGVSTFYEALMSAFWIWLGFIAAIMIGMVLWEGKSFKLYLLNVVYYLVVLAVAASIIFAF